MDCYMDVDYDLADAERDAFLDRMIEYYFKNQIEDRDWYELTFREKEEFENMFREHLIEEEQEEERRMDSSKYYMLGSIC